MRHERLEALETGRRPQLLRVVVDLERRHRVGKRDPGQLRARVDVNVGRDGRRVVERPASNESHPGAGVLAEDSDLARRTTPDLLLLPAVSRHRDKLRLAGEELHSVGLDQEVDDERAAGLSLTVQAMTAMNEERIGGQAVANRSAGAATLTWLAHWRVIAILSRSSGEIRWSRSSALSAMSICTHSIVPLK